MNPRSAEQEEALSRAIARVGTDRADWVDDPAEVAVGLAVARLLVAHGARLMLFRPALSGGVWDPRGGTGRSGYWFDHDWQHTSYDPDVVARWSPGMGLAMICGHVFDAVDNDPRNGGDKIMERLADAMPPVLMTAATPSSGSHHLIGALGITKTALAGVDIQAGLASCDMARPKCNGGHGFIFLAPTRKWSKTLERVDRYRWVGGAGGLVAPDLSVGVGAGLRSRIAEMRAEMETERRSRSGVGARPALRIVADGAHREFSPRQADEFIAKQVVARLREAPVGTVANTLFAASTLIGHFVGPHLDDESAESIMLEALSSCSGNDGSRTWDEMHEIRNGIAVGQNEWQATMCSGLNPFARYPDFEAISEAQGGIRALSRFNGSGPASDLAPAAPEELSACFLPEEFWMARPLFAHLRRVAWSAMESPEGVLFAALALIAARTMPNIIVGAPIGAPASLNHMFVLCGAPSDGKSVCLKLARGALAFAGDEHRGDDPFVAAPHSLHTFGPSSGQGIAGQYQKLVKPGGDMLPMLVRTRYCALAKVDESDTMGALLANKTNTIGADLRKGAMGEELGYGNVGDTQTNLPEHAYRLMFLMCMQPELSGWLLGTGGGGLPQRFVWVCVRDSRIVLDQPHPGKFMVYIPIEARPDHTHGGAPRAAHIMGYTDRIRDELIHARIQRKIHGGGALSDYDGHAMLNRYKLAGHLAIADGRIDHNDSDWELAGMAMACSEASLAWVQMLVARAEARDSEARAVARGRARLIEDGVVGEVTDARAKVRVSGRVLDWLGRVGAQGMTKTELGGKLHSDLRYLLDEVLTALLTSGQVRFEDIVRGEKQVGSRWFHTG